MRLADVYGPLVSRFSDNKHCNKTGTEFPRSAHTSGDAKEVDTLTQEKIPKLTSELKEQLKREGSIFFCRKLGHITKT